MGEVRPICCRPFRLPVPHWPRHASVSTSRSSNWMCGFPASGSRRRLPQSLQPLHVTPSASSENSLGVIRLIANLPFYRRFLRPPSTEAPSLHRCYPASSVLRASPPSHTAWPVSRELPVDPYCDHRWDFPCCTWSSPLRTCRRQYPGRSDGTCSLVPFHQLRPSHEPGRVGSCIVGFGACSAFTHVTAYTLAKSPSDSLHQRLQQSRCLHRCSDCYRVERTSSRAGLTPAVDHRLFTAHAARRQSTKWRDDQNSQGVTFRSEK